VKNDADNTYVNAEKFMKDKTVKVRMFDYMGRIIKEWSLYRTLRHTYATRLDERGVPVKVIQYLLGHESVKTTQDTYIDVSKERIAQFSDMVKGIFDTDFDTKTV
jgi:site-specific recombinase XerD